LTAEGSLVPTPAVDPMPVPSLRVIAHPEAGRRAFRRRWPPLAQALDGRGLAYDVRLTASAGEAIQVAREARAAGIRLVAAMGGDGTLHEVVNGLLGEATDPSTVTPADALPMLGLVPAGRGSDYARGLGLATDPQAIAARFGAALDGEPDATRSIDVGQITYRLSPLVAGRPGTDVADPDSSQGQAHPPVRRWFVNTAGIGFSPYVAQRSGRFPARLGPYLYTAAGLLTIVDWRERGVRLRWRDPDGAAKPAEERPVEAVEVALGPFEGGGMHVAPGADPSDGLFDVLVIDPVSRLEMSTFTWRIRQGSHLTSPRVHLRRASGLEVEVADGGGPLFLQADGELLGRDPFSFRIVPGALRFVV
jgi:diacylglycerol kinase (ATP)